MSNRPKSPAYIAVIADIKGSRLLANRDDTQNQLRETLRLVNERFADTIASKFTITLGDEFQGLLHSTEHLFPILHEIEQRMHPVKVRFGLGIGAITTDINPELAIGADGPAYYNARKSVEYLKHSEKKHQTGAADIRIEAGEEALLPTPLLNTVFLLLTAVKQTWSKQQRLVIWDMLSNRDTQSNVAVRMNIRQPSVQKSLASGNYYAYRDALFTVEQTLHAWEMRWENV